MSKPIRTRYAPSPTGFQHMGGIRTALYCYLFTRKMNGTFILRSEDTDQNRFVEGAEQYVIDALTWCGLECDEGVHVGGDYGPYRQSERKTIYRQYVEQLLTSGHAYYAFDTPAELDEMRERLQSKENPSPQYNAVVRKQMKNSLTLSKEEVKTILDAGEAYVVRLKVPAEGEVSLHDEVYGDITVQCKEIDDKILMKSDGMPTYHMANVVDDHLMEISHVIRGKEWLPSTPLHVLLYRFLGWEDTMPKFIHLPLILKPEGNGKLSKRAADKLGFPVFPLAWEHPTTDESSTGYREIGFLPDAFLNILAFLGWNPGTEQEIFSKEELINAFSIDRIVKSGARFDFKKAQWFNQHYIMEKSNEELAAAVLPFAPEAFKNVDKNYLAAACGLMKERMLTLTDLWTNAAYLFERPQAYDSKVVRKKWKEERIPLFEDLKKRLADTDDFSSEEVEKIVKAFVEESGLGFGNVLQPFRVMLAGIVSGPSVFEMAALLGKKEVIERMNLAAERFAEMNSAT